LQSFFFLNKGSQSPVESPVSAQIAGYLHVRDRRSTCTKTSYLVPPRPLVAHLKVKRAPVDWTNPLRRACWACRNLKRDAHDLTDGKARCGSSRFRVGLVGIHVCSWDPCLRSGQTFCIAHSSVSLQKTANWRQATTVYKQQLCRGSSHMSEQRRGLGDACVLVVSAEYASASSGSGDHPQQCYLLPSIVIAKKIFLTVTRLSEIISPD